ncbi:MAG: hypothetical protein Kow0010_18860 [Dehalococcoidia bacterium]
MSEGFATRIRAVASDIRIAFGVAAAVMVAIVVVVAAPGGDGGIAPPPAFAIAPSGDEVGRLVPVRVTFERPPRERDGTRILAIDPPVEGDYAWLDDRTLLFQPAYPGYLRGFTYRVRVAAQPDAGLDEDAEATFTAEGKLQVVTTIPRDGDEDVPAEAQILVQFSRSVAPLTIIEAMGDTPVLEFDPPLPGKGEWLNTSLYRFVPDQLAPNTRYTVTVRAGLTSAADGVLEEDYSWSFTSYGPALVRVTPDAHTQFAGPRQPVTLEFNQPMDRAAVEASFQLLHEDQPIPGTFDWSDDATVATFTPAHDLALLADHTIVVPAGLPGALGGQTRHEWRSTFRTVGPLEVRRTEPRDGATRANRWGIRIEFSHPIDIDSLEGRVSVDGIDQPLIESYADELSVYYSIPFDPSTAYTVRIAPGVRDRYGQVMGAYSFSFTTEPLPTMVSLAVPGEVGTFAASTEPIIYFHASNVAEARFTLWPLTESEAAQFHRGDPPIRRVQGWTPSQPVLRQWTEPVISPPDQVQIETTSLTGTGQPLPKGDYFVRTSGRSDFAFSVVDTAIVLKLGYDELLAWVLDYDTGEPVAGATLSASGDGLLADTAITGADGLASFPLRNLVEEGPYKDRNFVVTLKDGQRYGVASTQWQQGASPWNTGLPIEYYPSRYKGHVYTDRPIYRPGETVELKAIVREDDDATYRIPTGDPDLFLSIRDPRGNELYRERLTLNAYGSFAASIELDTDAATGSHWVQLIPITTVSFLVAEFVRPEFEVSIDVDGDNFADGDTITATAEARFFSGGALSGAEVSWAALSYPYSIRVEEFQRYSFSDWDYWRVFRGDGDPLRARGTGVTDDLGRFTFQVPAEILAEEGPRQYTISATVIDENGQAVAGSTNVTVHPADLYAGIRPTEYVAQAGEQASVDLVTITKEGVVAPGVPVTVEVYSRRWVTTKVQTADGARRYQSEPVDELLTTISVVTGADGQAQATFVPQAPGTLRVVAIARDAAGREARSATYVWVSGPQQASWRIRNDDLIELVADKDEYAPGDIAEVLVPAPFEGAIGLVTIERGKVHSREVLEFPTMAEVLRIPITDRSVPNVFVSVVLYRAPTLDDPIPRYKVGYVQLPVSVESRHLDVAITADRDFARPGETVEYTIRVTDWQGRPVQSELSVAVVDKAVLSLEAERAIDGLRAFWFERGLGVVTSSSLAVSVDRLNDVIAPPDTGGKGGGGFEDDQLREEFRNTAYWEAQLQTDANGVATVRVPLPDNLTTWRLQARAISGDILVGESTHELLSTRPLMVRPALPRFMRVGDELLLRALVRNTTPSPLTVTVGIEAHGVVLGNDDDQQVTVAPGQSEWVAWPASALEPGVASVTFRGIADSGDQDGVRIELPVHLDMTFESTATGGVVTTEPMLEAVHLPDFAVLQHGSLDIAVQPSLAGSMAGELVELDPRPVGWEGTPRVAARIVATAAVLRTAPAGSLPDRQNRLRSDAAILRGRQLADGGWPWCPIYCESDPLVTAWALIALGEARKAGIAIDEQAIRRADHYLTAYMNSLVNVEHPVDPNERAMFLYAIAVAGRGAAHTGEILALVEQYRSQLVSSGRAYALLAMHEAGIPADGLHAGRVLNDLVTTVVPSANGNHWEDDRRAGLVRSPAQATSLVLAALSRIQPDHPLIEETARWLVVARTAEPWQSDAERAHAIMGLSDFAASTGELLGDYAYRVSVDGDQVLGGNFTANRPATSDSTSVSLPDLGHGVSLLEFVKAAASPGRLYYTLQLRYLTPAREIEALNRGFAISRRYSLVDSPGTPIDRARVGDIVRVTVTIIAPQQRNYVHAQDFLPAGLEAIDTRLDIVDPALIAQLERERRQLMDQGEAPGYCAPWYRWYYNPWRQVDIRDDRVELRADRLPAGVHEYVYFARVTVPGTYFVAPAHVAEDFFPDVFGRSDSGTFVVTE